MADASSIQDLAKGPSPLARLIGTAPRPIKIIDFPGERGKGHAVGIYSLLDEETRQARMAAIKYLFDVCKLTELHLAFEPSIGEEEAKTQMLWRALRDPANPFLGFARTPDELRIGVTPDEREALWLAYLEFVDERSPIQKAMSDKEVDELTSALGKADTAKITLSNYDSALLRNIVRSMASRLSTLTKQLSSVTSQPSGIGSLPEAADVKVDG